MFLLQKKDTLAASPGYVFYFMTKQAADRCSSEQIAPLYDNRQ